MKKSVEYLNGFYPLPRSWCSDDEYFDGKFKPKEAWLDLLLLAKWQDESYTINGRLVYVSRGQLAVAQTTLAERWVWDKKRVKRALNKWSKLGRITYDTGQGIGVITICNYQAYQNHAPADAPANAPADAPADAPANAPADAPADAPHINKSNKRKNIITLSDESCDGANDDIFQKLIKCKKLSDLTFEQYKIATRSHPGMIEDSVGAIVDSANLLNGVIKHPGSWLRRRLSDMECDRGKISEKKSGLHVCSTAYEMADAWQETSRKIALEESRRQREKQERVG